MIEESSRHTLRTRTLLSISSVSRLISLAGLCICLLGFLRRSDAYYVVGSILTSSSGTDFQWPDQWRTSFIGTIGAPSPRIGLASKCISDPVPCLMVSCGDSLIYSRRDRFPDFFFWWGPSEGNVPDVPLWFPYVSQVLSGLASR